jgi:peptidoglycan/xylan/chitin deacetylase (PgdA/CDA1 family)
MAISRPTGIVPRRTKAIIRAGGSHLLGLLAVGLGAILRPGLVVRRLNRRFPDVLFHQPEAGPLVALTFDDSPHETLTPRILDLLAAHEARATFFMIGEHIAGNEEVVRRLVTEGHELGHHMMTDEPSVRLSAAEFEREFLETHELLSAFGPVLWFRPGHGWFNRRMLDQVHRLGYRCAMASAYSWEFLPIAGSYQARQILTYIRPGGIIVIHDGAADRERTVAALEVVLPALRQRGYRVVTLSELAARSASPGEQNGKAERRVWRGDSAGRHQERRFTSPDARS